MDSDISANSALSPSFSHIAVSRQLGKGTSHCSPSATPQLYPTEGQLLFSTPADTVLNRFRVVRQQDQALQSQRHSALQRLSDHHANVAARRQVASGRADEQMALLMQRNGRKLPPNLMKDATLLMDRAHSSRPSSPAGHSWQSGKELSRPATSSGTGRLGRVTPQQWTPEPCSLVCNSFRTCCDSGLCKHLPHCQLLLISYWHFTSSTHSCHCLIDTHTNMSSADCRQSLPPHTAQHAVTGSRKVYTPTTASGAAQSNLSRRTAYSEVLRRVRSAHGSPQQSRPKARSGADSLGPWAQ